MRSLIGPTAPATATPCILVVDDDRRVVDLLNIALAAHGYRVITASDGEEAVRVALGKRPDLVVLDVRLPKKSGLEVCEILRQDPDDPYLPIIMVSAASETEARLQGFARGADDYLTKPFSPKELVARIKRLLARASEARESRRRGREAELELARTRDDVKRAHAELRREQRLRELTAGLARDLYGALDADELAGRFLLAVRIQVGVSVAALLTAERAGGPFVPAEIRGDGLERIAGLEVRPDGELATLLAGMGRPVRRAELERFPELRAELPMFVAKGISLLAPLRGAGGLEGLLVAGERLDSEDTTRLDIDVLTLLCEAAAVGLANARRCRALVDGLIETLVARAGEVGPDDDSEARVEAASLADRAARALLLPPRMRGLIGHGVALGAWAESAVGRHALALAAAADPTGRLLDLARLIDRGAGPEGDDGEAPHEREAVMLLRVARDYAAARRRGSDAPQALAQAMDAAGGELDDATRQALSGAAREVTALGVSGR
ncbi:MAG: response regulator [Candidatus Eisenbacteria bacterium]